VLSDAFSPNFLQVIFFFFAETGKQLRAPSSFEVVYEPATPFLLLLREIYFSPSCFLMSVFQTNTANDGLLPRPKIVTFAAPLLSPLLPLPDRSSLFRYSHLFFPSFTVSWSVITSLTCRGWVGIMLFPVIGDWREAMSLFFFGSASFSFPPLWFLSTLGHSVPPPFLFYEAANSLGKLPFLNVSSPSLFSSFFWACSSSESKRLVVFREVATISLSFPQRESMDAERTSLFLFLWCLQPQIFPVFPFFLPMLDMVLMHFFLSPLKGEGFVFFLEFDSLSSRA